MSDETDPKGETAPNAAGETGATEAFGVQDIEWSRAAFSVFGGFCMGTAQVIPGVSGGTMAVVLGIYRQLLGGINSINAHAIKALLKVDIKRLLGVVHWRFLGALAVGLALAIVVMVKVLELPELARARPTHVYAAFFGLVLASAYVLARDIPEWTAARVVSLISGVGVGFGVVNLVPVETPNHPAFIFVCGVIAICAMLLPGISGSFILLIFGKWAYIMDAVGSLQLGVIIPFGLGCALGIAAFSRFLGWLLQRWYHTVIALLTGLIIGSLWRIWPYQQLETVVVRGKERVISSTPHLPDSFEAGVLLLAVAGVVSVLAIEYFAARRAKPV